ncbi:MAG: hypothetical protein M5U26_08375 [Planctomycetota bacterium]|nr:hypothetical protein [Planctomycetota bacterium]
MPTTSNDQRLAERLIAKRKDLQDLCDETQVVNDVLDGPAALKTETYLPQHQAEHPDEYAKRKRLTPVFSETPGVLQSRMGALAKQPPAFTLPEKLKPLDDRATLKGLDLRDLFFWAATHGQIEGFCGILIDRKPLPTELQGREISEAQQQEAGLDRVWLAPYGAEQILDWKYDDKGLLWVRLVEQGFEQPSWDAKPVKVWKVRVVDRQTITVYVVRQISEAEKSVEIFEPVAHAAKDSQDNPCVPFTIFHPFPAKDGIGRSVLKPGAEADVAALWLLSELLWLCYMLAPILTLKHNRTDEELQKIELGASRFVPLNAGVEGAQNPEELAYVAVDPTPIEKLMQVWEKMVGKAKEFGGKQASAAVPVATEQSGISKAWSFKTSEERILFMLARALDQGFTGLLQIAAQMSGVPAEKIEVKSPDSFDVSDAAETFDLKSAAVEFFQGFGLNTAVVALLSEAVDTMLPNLSPEKRADVEEELKAVLEEELRPGRVLDATPAPEPKSLGELAKARDQARKVGDQAEVERLGAEIKKRLAAA